MPKFEEADHITVKGAAEFRTALPLEAKFIFKLYYRNGNVLCLAKAQYGKDEYELNRNYHADEIEKLIKKQRFKMN